MTKDGDDLLNESLDGRLDQDRAARLRARLKAEPELARRLKALEELRRDLRLSLPLLSEADSRRLWLGVRARVRAAGASDPAPVQAAASGRPAFLAAWSAWWSRPWVPAWSLGLAGAAAALALVFLIQPWSGRPVPPVRAALAASARGTLPSSARRAGAPVAGALLADAFEEAARRPQRRVRPEALAPSRASVAPVPVLAGLPVSAYPTPGPGATEVQRALADDQADAALLGQFLSRQTREEPVVAMLAPSASDSGSSEDTVAYQPESSPVLQEESGSGVAGVAQGGRQADGFWNWAPAAQAMDHRDWAQARVELDAAAAKAGSPAERAFAHSALRLLAAPGGPLEGESVQNLLPSGDELRVLGAGTWQLLVDSRLARFSRGVAVRLPGLREDGDSFLLDLGFNRGEFSPGSHFVRVSGEAPARVLDASGQPVSEDDFYAPSGADYDLQAKVLRLR